MTEATYSAAVDEPETVDHHHLALAEPKTKEQWRLYVAAEAPEPPELPSITAYRRLSSREREELDERRYDYHSALVIVQTPALLDLHRTMLRTARMNHVAPAGARRGHVIDGESSLGKSTILKTFGRDYERRLQRRRPELYAVPGRDFTPVVYISIPTTQTPKGLSLCFADYLALPVRSGASTTQITDAVLNALRMCGTEVVLIDDIHFLDCSQKEGRVANDHLKYLANYCAATFIYAGVDVESGSLFSEGGRLNRATQTAGRFSVLPLTRFGLHIVPRPQSSSERYAAVVDREREEWKNLVLSLEVALRLYRHRPGVLVEHWEYLLERTGGVIGTLSALIRAAAINAIDDGSEKITRAISTGSTWIRSGSVRTRLLTASRGGPSRVPRVESRSPPSTGAQLGSPLRPAPRDTIACVEDREVPLDRLQSWAHEGDARRCPKLSRPTKQ